MQYMFTENHIVVSGNSICHQALNNLAQEVFSTMCAVRQRNPESLQATSISSAAPETCSRQRQEPKDGWGVFPFLQAVVRGAPAWSQDGGQSGNHRVKIEPAGSRTCLLRNRDGWTSAHNKALRWQTEDNEANEGMWVHLDIGCQTMRSVNTIIKTKLGQMQKKACKKTPSLWNPICKLDKQPISIGKSWK